MYANVPAHWNVNRSLSRVSGDVEDKEQLVQHNSASDGSRKTAALEVNG